MATIKRKVPRVLKTTFTTKLCILIIILATAFTSVSTEDSKQSGLVGDSLANFTNDQKDRDRLSSVSPFPDNNAPSVADTNKTQSTADGSHIANISTITNNSASGNETKEVQATTTTTTTTTPAPLIPPATVNASIAQMNSSTSSKKKGQIIIR